MRKHKPEFSRAERNPGERMVEWSLWTNHGEGRCGGAGIHLKVVEGKVI